MSSKRRLRRKQCGSKTKFEAPEHGQKAIANMRRRNTLLAYVVVYKCQFCGKYHIGHPMGTRMVITRQTGKFKT